MRVTVFAILTIFCSLFGYGQFTISGKVIDENQNPVPFTNVVFTNTSIGTTTDFNGFFELEAPTVQKEIKVLLLGYGTRFIKLKKRNPFLTIVLHSGEELEEVVVIQKPKKRLKKKENPAYRILKEVWRRKANLGLPQTKSYAFEKYATVEVGLNNMDTIFLEKLLRKNMDSVITAIKQNPKNNFYYIPINLKEEHWDIYGDNTSNLKRENLKARRISGLETNGFFFKRVEKIFKDIQLMDETIVVADVSFASPIAKSGFVSYDYVLADSVETAVGKEYKIYFFPRENGDRSFEGNMTITSPAYAVKEVDMRIRPDINLNMFRNVVIKQQFKEVDPGIFLLDQSKFEADFTVLTKNENEKGLYLIKTEDYSGYRLNQKIDKSAFDKKERIKSEYDLVQTDDYWKKLSQEPNPTIAVLNELKNNKKVKSITNNVDFFTTGYINISPSFQFGKWRDALNYNDVEGYRLDAGFRTFKDLDDRFRSTSFVAYGFKDKSFKYGVDGRYLIDYNLRFRVGLVYSKDIEQLGNSIFSTGILLDTKPGVRNNLFSRGNNYYLTAVETYGLNTQIEPFKNLFIGMNFAAKHFAPGDINYFDISFKHQNKILSQYNSTSISGYVTFTPNRNVYGYGVEQKLGRNYFAKYSLKYTRGIPKLFGSDFSYDQLQFSYDQPIRLGYLGILESNIEIGKTFDPVPITIINALPANQGYTIRKKTFTLINYYDWVSDNYIMGHFEHHFNGFLMNKIPFIKKLRMRSLLTFRFAYGSISDENISRNKSSIVYNAPDENPYYEYGFGMENIGFGNLRIFRIDMVWRSSLLETFVTNIPSNNLPNFGVRIGASLGL